MCLQGALATRSTGMLELKPATPNAEKFLPQRASPLISGRVVYVLDERSVQSFRSVFHQSCLPGKCSHAIDQGLIVNIQDGFSCNQHKIVALCQFCLQIMKSSSNPPFGKISLNSPTNCPPADHGYSILFQFVR